MGYNNITKKLSSNKQKPNKQSKSKSKENWAIGIVGVEREASMSRYKDVFTRGGHVLTGHTAIYLRKGDEYTIASGFDPANYWEFAKVFTNYTLGRQPQPVQGAWAHDIEPEQADKALIADPKRKQFEIPVTEAIANEFKEYFQQAKDSIRTYAANPGKQEENINLYYFENENDINPEAIEGNSVVITGAKDENTKYVSDKMGNFYKHKAYFIQDNKFVETPTADTHKEDAPSLDSVSSTTDISSSGSSDSLTESQTSLSSNSSSESLDKEQEIENLEEQQPQTREAITNTPGQPFAKTIYINENEETILQNANNYEQPGWFSSLIGGGDSSNKLDMSQDSGADLKNIISNAMPTKDEIELNWKGEKTTEQEIRNCVYSAINVMSDFFYEKKQEEDRKVEQEEMKPEDRNFTEAKWEEQIAPSLQAIFENTSSTPYCYQKALIHNLDNLQKTRALSNIRHQIKEFLTETNNNLDTLSFKTPEQKQESNPEKQPSEYPQSVVANLLSMAEAKIESESPKWDTENTQGQGLNASGKLTKAGKEKADIAKDIRANKQNELDYSDLPTLIENTQHLVDNMENNEAGHELRESWDHIKEHLKISMNVSNSEMDLSKLKKALEAHANIKNEPEAEAENKNNMQMK